MKEAINDCTALHDRGIQQNANMLQHKAAEQADHYYYAYHSTIQPNHSIVQTSVIRFAV
jgi:hypothetical protein